MARRFKLIGKKRGDRATGSRRGGRFGEAIFYLALLILSSGALVTVVLNLIVPEWRVNQVYEPSQGLVLDTKIEVVQPDEEEGQDAGARDETAADAPAENQQDSQLRYRPQIQIQYEVDSEQHTRWTYRHWKPDFVLREDAVAVTERFQIGQSYPCWYDPDDPQQVVLERGYNWWVWLILILPTTFVLVGISGLGYTLFYSGTSRERRAAIAKQVADTELFDNRGGEATEFPFVPADSNLKNSPGTTLKYRLPIANTPGWKLAGFVGACLAWNGFLSIFVVMAVNSHVAGAPDWLLTLFMLPFVGIGIWLVYRAIRQILIATGVGPTFIEIANHPLQPGQDYEMLLSQGGSLSIRQLEVHLICLEKATYRQGTDTVTDIEIVCQQPVLTQKDIDVQAGLPYETRCQFRVPEGAMHSFLANSNAVNWKLSVRVEVQRWPDFRRDFPLVVRPHGVEANAR